MIYNIWHKMEASEKTKLLEQAAYYLKQINLL